MKPIWPVSVSYFQSLQVMSIIMLLLVQIIILPIMRVILMT